MRQWDVSYDADLAELVLKRLPWSEVARRLNYPVEVCIKEWRKIRKDWTSPPISQKVFDRRTVKDKGSPDASAKRKRMALDKYTCQICGLAERNGALLHVHHIVPAVDGGTGDIDNLITLCSGCHMSVTHGSIETAIFSCVTRAVNQSRLRNLGEK